MKVTVITPTFNRANMLKETIESVLAQSFRDFEYIIIDDGSTDHTKDLVGEFLSDPRVSYYYHDNIGEAESVNRGWRLARGEYFTQVNSDDPVYPLFLEKMIAELDKHPNIALCYSDFDFIDEYGKIIQTTKGRPWDFIRNLSEFSCEAACPGTTLRRSSFSDLTSIKRKGYKHINDVEMYWNLALKGDFLHVPQVLTTWRMHPGQISASRYNAIPECEDWFNKYFSKDGLPDTVQNIRHAVRKSLDTYYQSLLNTSNLSLSKQKEIKKIFKKKYGINFSEFMCVQVGDTDLTGNKFNGHDLHHYLQERGIDAVHFVCTKQSDDENTFVIDGSSGESLFRSVVMTPQFAAADIVHLHLIHNIKFDVQHIPFLSTLKPLVLTLHDPWTFGGHCIYHGECEKWKTHCHDCQYLSSPFSLKTDLSALEFAKKHFSIQASNIHGIVASQWMMRKALQSPVWKGKSITHIPFGIDQNIFKPGDMVKARRKLGIPEDSFVLFARTQKFYKGIKILRESLAKIYSSKTIVLLTVGQNGLLSGLQGTILHKEYGWINNDHELAMLYQASDLFLMPSEQEAFGMMAIEAMSCSKMVLSLIGTALPEVINANTCGIAVKSIDYADELQRLIDNPEEIEERGKRSLKFAQAEYNKDVYVQRLVDVYRKAILDFEKPLAYDMLMDQISKYAKTGGDVTPDLFCKTVQNKSSVFLSRINPKINCYFQTLSVYRRQVEVFYKKNGLVPTISKILRTLQGD